MNSELFLNKLNNYFATRSDFLSLEQLSSCFNKYTRKGFTVGERVICGESAGDCISLFSEDELNVAILFLQKGTLLENLKENTDSLLNRYTYSNFKSRSISLFTKTAVVLRGTRYV